MPKTIGIGIAAAIAVVSVIGGTFAVACFVGEPEVDAALGMHATLLAD